MKKDSYCVDYIIYNKDDLPVQSLAFVFAQSKEEAIQKVKNRHLSKITIISCDKYA